MMVFALYFSADDSGLLILPLVNSFHEVWVPYWSADGSRLLILPLFKGFHDGLHAILLSRWQRIAHSSTRQKLS